MPLNETITDLEDLLHVLSRDLTKVNRGNKSAAQRIRVNTVRLEKVAKRFRKESLLAEQGGKLKKRRPKKRKRRISI